ncbi:hypothetical protein BKA69DRAFT_1166372 [Paraphysoderma sedebokerense]|nr:hypothetical protein BKA69DRAFT_1166372 [Paraphysoderma sedebokerense]
MSSASHRNSIHPQGSVANTKSKVSSEWANIVAEPLDFSFKELSNVTDIITEEPRSGSKYQPKQEDVENKKAKITILLNPSISTKIQPKLVTTALRLNNNRFYSLDGLDVAVGKVLENKENLKWIDASFNELTAIDQVLSQFPNITHLYLHANRISSINTLEFLENLPKLHTLTLHGNPVASHKDYKTIILNKVPNLKHLDFYGVTKMDREIARRKAEKKRTEFD